LDRQSKTLEKTLLIMDEVDGMSTGDRGGIAAIIAMIKNSKIPIICICNDRDSQKIKSLAGHCYDIKFHKPDRRLIVKRLKSILDDERAKYSEKIL
jgi:replication factor C subunit 1